MSRKPGSGREVLHSVNPEALRAARQVRGLSLLELSKLTHLSKSTMSALENIVGYGIGSSSFARIVEALEVPWGSLLKQDSPLEAAARMTTLEFTRIKTINASAEDLAVEEKIAEEYLLQVRQLRRYKERDHETA